jgi:Cu(I)/Ag(I) efflux system membrane fusion protein
MRIFMLTLLLFFFVPPAFAANTYICPMHPHISGEKGDFCPICAMALTPKMTAPKAAQGVIKIDAEYVQILGVKTQAVTMREFGKSVTAFGNISASTRHEYPIDIRVKGWVNTLKASAVGDHVKRGDLLFTLYSPELMEAQADFLLGRRIGNQEQRLRLYGMDTQSIAALKAKGAFLEETPFYAPADGIVTALNARQGAFIAEGGNIMTIQDFSKLWVDAELPLKDLVYVKQGESAQITLPEAGVQYDAVIDAVYPNADIDARTVKVRLLLDNTDLSLKAGSYVSVVFSGPRQARLAVPQEAVIYGAEGAHVIESLGEGRFRPLKVQIGMTSEGYSEILSGVKTGQIIVQSGQFMIDAESNLRGGVSSMSSENSSAAPVQEGGMSHVH